MTKMQLKTGRAVAISALNQFKPKKNYTIVILDKSLDQTKQKQRATDLVYGTIRNLKAIDSTISRICNCPVERISSTILNILRVAVYELVYSPQTPEYSIVNEAVENAKAVANKKKVGFVNAILRNINQSIQNRQVSLVDAELRRTLPRTPQKGCLFNCNILPDPEELPDDYLSTAFSLPKWLIADWLTHFGREKTRQICFASNRRPGIYIRANALKTTAEQLADKLNQEGVDVFVMPDGVMLQIKAPSKITALPGFKEGLFTVQDITASQMVRVLQPQNSWTILDLCAAPGGKTTQLAEMTSDKSKIIATDINKDRLKMLRENINRLGLKSIEIAEYEDIQRIADDLGGFDCVLSDVPCSNTAVLAKRVEVKYRLNVESIKAMAKTQLQLLAEAAKLVKPKGTICYCTCSIMEAENHALINDFLADHSFKLERERLFLPSADDFDCDGGYVAILTQQ